MFITNPGKVSDHIWFLGSQAMPSYLIMGREGVIIDTGVSISGPNILTGLKDVLGDTKELKYIFLTHSHFDHCGSAPFLKREIPGLRIGASKVCSEVFFNPKAVDLIKDLCRDTERSIDLNAVFPGMDISFDEIAVDRVLKEGDRIDLGGVEILVYNTPGHTRCSLGYYIIPDRAIFCGETSGVPDTMGEILPEFLSSYDDYINSLRKLSGLEVDIIGLAHGGLLTGEDAYTYFSRSIEATERFRSMIEDYLEKYEDMERVVETIAEEQYSKGTILQAKRPYMINLRAKVKAIARKNG